jgi:hypothetical protein
METAGCPEMLTFKYKATSHIPEDHILINGEVVSELN